MAKPVDFSDPSYGLSLGHTYNDIVYSPSFLYMQLLKQSSEEVYQAKLDGLAAALCDLESGAAGEAWDSYNQPPYIQRPSTNCWAATRPGAPDCTIFRALEPKDYAVIFTRRQALMIWVEATEQLPWSFLDLSSFGAHAQVSLFSEWSVFGDPGPMGLDYKPLLYDLPLGEDHVFPANAMVLLWNTNPWLEWEVATEYLGYIQPVLDSIKTPASRIEAGYTLVPDFCQFELAFWHQFSKGSNGKLFRKKTFVDSPQFASACPTGGVYPPVAQMGDLGKQFDSLFTSNCGDAGSKKSLQYPYWCVGATFGNRGDGCPVVSFADLAEYGVSAGCHLMAEFIQSLLRAVNLPAEVVRLDTTTGWTKYSSGSVNEDFGWHTRKTHASIVTGIGRIGLQHADNVYGLPNQQLERHLPRLAGADRWWSLDGLQRMFGQNAANGALNYDGRMTLESWYRRIQLSCMAFGVEGYGTHDPTLFSDSLYQKMMNGTWLCDAGGKSLDWIDERWAAGTYSPHHVQFASELSIAELRQEAIQNGYL